MDLANETSIAYTVLDNAGAVVQLVEVTVFTYHDENGPLIVAETHAHLENALRTNGQAYRDVSDQPPENRPQPVKPRPRKVP